MTAAKTQLNKQVVLKKQMPRNLQRYTNAISSFVRQHLSEISLFEAFIFRFSVLVFLYCNVSML